ncbi:di-trans,poly-cis-decaprenylcistransferase [Candidatus Daviesbacteria bacterium]|nr:di-trans,poly-cis-decaprenylcistransferase [Candidatus Daviesbacteria bacterium]
MSNLKLDPNNIPSHIAIIMDGNRRWAKKRLMPSFMGHEFGRRQLKPVIREAAKLGVKFLTFWAFSTENWNRSDEEKEAIFNILRRHGKRVLSDLQKNGVRLLVIGEIERFPQDIQEILKETIQATSNNKTITVNLALSYGGRSEILRAVKNFTKVLWPDFNKIELKKAIVWYQQQIRNFGK